MEHFEPIDIDFVINNEEVKNRTESVRKDLMKVGLTAEEAQAKIDKKIRALYENDALKKIPELIKNPGDEALRAAPKFNGLGNSINQISREMSAFTVSAQTGFLAVSNNIPILADEINRLKIRNAELTASGQKAVPVWQQVAKGLFSWQTALSLGITLLTIYGAEFIKWVGSLFKGKEAIDELKSSQQALNDTFNSGSYQKVIRDILELQSYIKLAKDGIIDKDVALKKYNETLGKASTEVTNLADAEQGVIDKAPAYVKAMLYKAAAAQASGEAAKQLAESAKKEQQINEDIIKAQKAYDDALKNPQSQAGQATGQFTNVNARQSQNIQESLKRDLEELKAERDKLNSASINVITKLNEEAARIAKAAGLDIFGEDDKDKKEKVVSDYQSLLDRLSDLDKEYSRKSFTKDEEELQALRDKFDKIRTLVERFNADPKNKAQIIDLTNLDQLQVKAEASLTYRQTTEKLKDELDEQQKLFADFETYKSQFGIAAAKKEFEGRIGEAESYYEFLKQKQKENEDSYEAVNNGTAIGGEIERVQFLNKALAAEAAKQKKLFDDQLAALKDYQTKRNLLIEKYEAQRANLISQGKDREVVELERQHKEELDDLDDANTKKLRSYTALFDGVKNLTIKNAKQVIADAKALMATQIMSAELRVKIEKQIAEVEKIISNTKLDNIYKIAHAIGDLGQSLADLGDSLGNSGLSNAGGLLAGLASGVDGLLTVFDKESNNSDKIAAGIQGAINLVSMFASAAAKRKAAEEAYYLSVIGYQQDYNLALAEQIRLRSILDENVFIKDYEGRVKDALESIKTANDEYQSAIDKLIKSGQVKIGQRNAVDWGNVGSAASNGALVGAAIGSFIPVVGTVIGAIGGAIVGAIGGLFGGKKKKDRFGEILSEYPELLGKTENGVRAVNVALAESLIANNLVKGETKQILENIIEWQKALDEARAQIKEVITELSGGLGNDLRTLLVDAFVAGENAAVKMGDTVEKVLENILSNLIFNNVFGEVFDDLEAQMAASFDIGGDGSWVDDFSRFFTEASALTDDFNEALAAAQQEAANFGFEVFKPEDKDKPGLAGQIRRELTEETGGELLGLFRGQYDVTRRLLEATEIYYEKENKHHDALLNLIALTTLIEAHTGDTVVELQTAIVELRKIADNTQKIYINDLG